MLQVAYACTKAALVGLTRSLALELAPSHIRVNCVAPGVINTDMVQVLGQETLRDLAEQTPLGRLGTPEDVAHAVAFLASDKASFLTGQILAADGGFIVEDCRTGAAQRRPALRYVRPAAAARRITRPKQASVRPLPAVSTTSASARARFREKRYTVPAGSL